MGMITYNVPAAINFTRNPISYKIGTDIAPDEPGLFIECKIEEKPINGLTFAEVIRFPLTPDGLGMVEIDIARVADKLVEYYVPTPTSTNTFTAHTQSCHIRITFTEYSQAMLDGGDPVQPANIVVVKGGIAFERYQSNTYFQNRQPSFKFLSWMPLQRSIPFYASEWISYLHLSSLLTDGILRFVITYEDGTTDTILKETGNLNQYTVYHFAIGYLNMALAATDLTKTVHYYEVTLLQDVTAISETVRLYVDYTPAYEPVYLNYFNSLGGYEGIAITGQVNLAISRTFDLADVNTSRLSPQLTRVIPMSRMNTVSEEVTYKGNIGITNSWTLHDLRREIFLSEEIYTIKNNRWWPVNVLDKSMDFGPLSAQIKEVPIEWGFAFSNTQYTPETANMGNPPGFQLVTFCPVPTFMVGGSTLQVSFVHSPAPVNQYDIILLNASNVQIGATISKTIPYTSTITHTFTGLSFGTDFKIRVVMRNTDTGELKTCTYATLTTAADDLGDPATPLNDYYPYVVKLSDNINTVCAETDVTVYSISPTFGSGVSGLIYYNTILTIPVSDKLFVRDPDGIIWSLEEGYPIAQVGVC